MSTTYLPTYKLTNDPNLWGKVYLLAEDNWFNGFDVFDWVCTGERGMGYIATIRTNRKGQIFFLRRVGMFGLVGI
jgi:hypothetical protein